MKLTKKALKDLIQETIMEHRSWDEDEPTNTPQARAKDNLQTAMLDAAQTFLAQHFADVEDEKVKEETIYNTYSELETILVDAMTGWDLSTETNQWRYAGKGDPLL